MSHAAAPPPPAAAPAAAAPAPSAQIQSPLIDTAERLYIQMVAGAVQIGEGTAKLPVDAKSLAKMSFELSQAFHDVEVSRRVKPVLTTATFDANMCDFDAWSAPAASTPPAA
jgi:hypothetical protein